MDSVDGELNFLNDLGENSKRSLRIYCKT